MAILPILTWPDARLSMRADPVDVVDAHLRQLADDMLETMYAAPGRGLAAPQVGQLLRMFVMDVTWKDGLRAPRVFINPVILSMQDERATGAEGCLSIPGVTAFVSRATEIRMAWTDLEGKARVESLTGFAAICAQHEYDHLDGILTLDRVAPEDRARMTADLQA